MRGRKLKYTGNFGKSNKNDAQKVSETRQNGRRDVNNYYVTNYKTERKELSKDEYRLLWNLMWFTFIFGLCWVFNSAWPLLFMFLVMLGWY